MAYILYGGNVKLMKFILKLLLFIIININLASSNDLDLSNSLFDEGKFEEAVNEAKKLNTIESKIFCARTLAIYKAKMEAQ